MGFISSLAQSEIKDATRMTSRPFRRSLFMDKERTLEERRGQVQSHYNSTLSTDLAFKRLLEAMRSKAPGGWSDDRWEQSRHYEGITYIAIYTMMKQMGQSEFQVFHRDPDHPKGKRPVKSTHDLIKLLQNPNDDDSWGDVMEEWTLQYFLTGTALTWIIPNRLGEPIELYSIPTAIAIPQPAVNPDYPHGYYRIQPLYPYGPFSSYPTPSTSVGAPIPGEWMMRFKNTHPLLRYEGYSPLTALRLHIDEVTSIDKSRYYSMRRVFSPSAVLQAAKENAPPLPPEEIDRMKAQFEIEQQGEHNTGNLYVTSPGYNLEPWGANPRDMEYQAGWEQLVSFVMGGFGVTKQAAGMIEDSAYATLFATLKQLHILTLQPFCRKIGSKITKRLASHFGDDLIVEVNCPRIDDHEIKFRELDTAIRAYAISKNELRRELSMSETDEEWGKEMAGQQPQPEQQPGMPGMEQAGGGMAEMGEEYQDPMEEYEESVDDNQPDPGTLNENSLGPRKSLYNRLNGFAGQNGTKLR